MRIAINDHSGHSFILQLSMQLALLGHEVLHSYSTSFQSPKGDLIKRKSDLPNFNILPIANKNPFAKYSLLKRRKQEIEYGKILAERLHEFKPDALIGGTAPLFVQDYLQKYCLKNNIDFKGACTKTYGYIENTVYQIRQLLASNKVHGKIFYLGDLPPTQISEWANEISFEMKRGSIKKIPYFFLKAGALTGDILARFKIKFPLTTSRLFNMTTNNILPLEDIYEIAGDVPCSRKQGITKTL